MNDLQLKCFMAAAEYENFTKAAEKLYISQPVIGRHISHLEDELGFELFHRERKSVKLTENGYIFLEFLRDCQERYETVMSKIETNLRSNSMDLFIGTAEGILLGDTYQDIFQHILQAKPELRVIVSYFLNFGLSEALKKGAIDAAVISLDDVLPDLELYDYKLLKMITSGLVIPASHPAAHKEKLEPSDFKNDKFILLSDQDSEIATRMQKQTMKQLGMEKYIIAPNVSTLAVWAEAGIGITSITSNHKVCYTPNVVFRELPIFRPTYEVFVWRKKNNNPAIHVFCDIIEKLGYGKDPLPDFYQL